MSVKDTLPFWNCHQNRESLHCSLLHTVARALHNTTIIDVFLRAITCVVKTMFTTVYGIFMRVDANGR